MIFFDTETCGLHGFPVLIQWAEDDGPIQLYSPWTEPIAETLKLIEYFCEKGVVGFNLSFDWFQLCKTYTVFSLLPNLNEEPLDNIQEIALLEPKGRDGPCIKPSTAFDVMLHARKGPYQSTMDRGDIRIRRVPTTLAWQLAAELEKRVPLRDIYFARKKDKTRWHVDDVKDADGEIDPHWKDIVLKFAPSSALKALAADALDIRDEEILLFGDVELKDYPEELGYAPFALAIGSSANWKDTWPDKIKRHISHWRYNERARRYASDDVRWTRDLYRHFGSPPAGDDDSILACMVAAVRWKGFRVNTQGLKALRDKTLASKFKGDFKIPTAPAQARNYVTEFMDETEKLIVNNSTKKVLLQEIATWTKDCPACGGEGCTNCKEGGIRHPAAIRAEEILAARQAQYEANLFDKFLLAGRFHASFNVIGALSSRMSGADDLNAQGIKKTKEVRGNFPLAWPGQTLCGGDFAGFEVTLAEACYNDPALRRDLMSGKKIHALFGVHVFPNMTYEEILKSEGTSDDKYTKCKQAVFAMFYGGTAFTLKDRLGVDIETAEKAEIAFGKQYPGVAIARQKVIRKFQSMVQKGGIGSRIEWNEPADKIESMFGFPRYFTLENQICKQLFLLANQPPKEWRNIKVPVLRRDRTQTASGAVQSALFAAAFSIQSSNTRAAANHEIQSSGATITKQVQRSIWDLQPVGVHEWIVQPMNIHDEIMCPTKPGHEADVKRVVDATVESIRPKVPLIKMDWVTGLNSWAEKS